MIYPKVREFNSRYKELTNSDELEILALDIMDYVGEVLNDPDIYRNKTNEVYQLMVLVNNVNNKKKGLE